MRTRAVGKTRRHAPPARRQLHAPRAVCPRAPRGGGGGEKRPSLSQGGAGYIMLGVLEFWWELGGWAMAEFYRELRERPGLQFDLCFMGRTEPLASRSSFTPLHWERKSHASCLQQARATVLVVGTVLLASSSRLDGICGDVLFCLPIQAIRTLPGLRRSQRYFLKGGSPRLKPTRVAAL